MFPTELLTRKKGSSAQKKKSEGCIAWGRTWLIHRENKKGYYLDPPSFTDVSIDYAFNYLSNNQLTKWIEAHQYNLDSL